MNNKIWDERWDEGISNVANELHLFITKMQEIADSVIINRSIHSIECCKDGVWLVVSYVPATDDFVGAIMTEYVHNKMMLDMKQAKEYLPAGYFAWAHKYGFDYKSNGWSPANIFQSISIINIKLLNQVGTMNENMLYIVQEYIDDKPKGEYGVKEEYRLVGVFDNVLQAENAAVKVLSEDGEWNTHDVQIIPTVLNNLMSAENRCILSQCFYIE